MSIRKLESDMLAMIELSAELGSRETELMYCINAKDTYNFDLEKAENIKRKIATVRELLDALKTKWID